MLATVVKRFPSFVRPKATDLREMRSRPQPCFLCGFAARVEDSEQRYGATCIWYGVYMPKREMADAKSSIREACMKDGNNFTFRLKGVSAVQLLDIHMKRTDWALTRRALKLTLFVSAISVLISAIGIWLR